MLVQRGEHRQHDDGRAAGHRDDAARPVVDGARVDLGHDERHFGVVTEGLGRVDDERARRRRERHPLGRDLGRRGEDDDVDAVKALAVERLDLDLLGTHEQATPGVLVGAEQAHVLPGVDASRQDLEHGLTDQPRGADDGQGGTLRLSRVHAFEHRRATWETTPRQR